VKLIVLAQAFLLAVKGNHEFEGEYDPQKVRAS